MVGGGKALAELTYAVDSARTELRRAQLGDDDHDRAACWSELAGALADRFEQASADPDLDEAIDAFRQSVSFLPHGEYLALALSDLGGALLKRYMVKHRQRDIDEAVAVLKRAEQIGEPDGPSRAQCLTNLAAASVFRYETSKDSSDLTTAIGKLQAGLKACPPDSPERFRITGNLSYAQMRYAEHIGSAVDLDALVTANRRAVRATALGDPERAAHLSNLSTILRARFVQHQRLSDADESVDYARQAVAALSPQHTKRAFMLNDLGCTLHARFVRTGSVADVNEAVEALRRSVSVAGPGRADSAGYLANLAWVLLTRYQRSHSTLDLDESIDASQHALPLAEGYVYHSAVLSYLSVALWEKGEQPGADPKFLDEAVRYGRLAIDAAAPERYDRFNRMDALALILRSRWHQTGAVSDLNEAIDLGREAIRLAPAGFPDRKTAMTNLSGTLQLRGALTGQETDVTEARQLARQSLAATPRDYQDRAVYLVHAASSMLVGASSRKESRQAAKFFIAAAEDAQATPSIRVTAARGAANLLADREPRRAAALLEQAVGLLPQVVPRRLIRTDQQFQLRGTAGLASDAAALALADTRPKSRAQRASRALTLLEHGRGILLSQALDTHSDLTDLRASHVEFAERYEWLRDQLDQPAEATADVLSAVLRGPKTAGLPAPAALSRAQVAAQFAEAVHEIRGLSGFGQFMLPPGSDELIRAALYAGTLVWSNTIYGATVMFNVSEYRSDALLMHPRFPGFIDYLPLPGLTPQTLAEKVELFSRAQALRLGSSADLSGTEDPEAMLLTILEWLWNVAAEPVLDALNFRGSGPVSGPEFPFGWPEIRWIPGGLLGQLPIHAAGYHRPGGAVTADGAPRTVIERVVSSYAPTLRALTRAADQDKRLAAARSANPGSSSQERSLVVVMPVTPGAEELSGAVAAATRLQAMLPGAELLMPPHSAGIDPALVLASPTRAEVLSRLNGVAIAHFVCHGVTDAVDPSLSKLLLSDHDSTPLTVARLAPVRLNDARLAYLSACSTARNPAAELADESIHLASAFQLAGFPHVIGTLWEVEESVAFPVAEAFYASLRTGEGDLDVKRSARALHELVRELRADDPDAPFTWGAYLHVGS